MLSSQHIGKSVLKVFSDYKVDFGDECQKCDLKEICGGVFDSTKRVIHFKGKPIKR